MTREEQKWTVAEQTVCRWQMGAIREKDGIRFTTAVPAGKAASLLLYKTGSTKPECEIPFPKTPVMGRIYSMKILGLPWQKYEYNFQIGEQIVLDAYAGLISHAEESDSAVSFQKCGFSFKRFDWENDRKLSIPYEEAVMYHLHVRNYTMNRKSGVRNKGTFRGLEEKIPYLKGLGINQIKLMPIYEFQAEVRGTKKNCWGYQSGCYFAPKTSYAATKNPDIELKHMIRAFHQNGIEVLLDFWFGSDASPKMITECLLYWIQEYHIDGFHVIGADEVVRKLASDPTFSDTKILCVYYPEHSLKLEKNGMRNAAEINDGFLVDMRRLLKGDEGALQHMAYRNRRNPDDMAVINYMTNHDGFTLQDMVSYDQKHNEENGENGEDGTSYNFSWNCGAEGVTRKKAVLELRIRQRKNAILMMMLSQGVPMLLGGDEFGNSQNGNNNPYCLDNEISWVGWNHSEKGKEFLSFVTQCIAFRREHPILHMPHALELTDYRSLGYPDLSYHSENAWYGGFDYQSKQIGMMYCEKYCGMDEMLYVAYNFQAAEQDFALPKLPENWHWYCEIDTSKEESFCNGIPLKQTRMFTVPARTIMVLIGREAQEYESLGTF